MESTDEFEAAARAEKARREAEGVGDAHQAQQPPVAPEVQVGDRLEQLCHYVVVEDEDEGEEGKEGKEGAGGAGGASAGWMWCACSVLAVEDVPKGPRSVYKPGEAARVRWDNSEPCSS